MISFVKRLFLAKRLRRFSSFNVLLKMLLKQGKFNIACYLIDKMLSIFKLYIYTFWQKRKLERITFDNVFYLRFLVDINKYIDTFTRCFGSLQNFIENIDNGSVLGEDVRSPYYAKEQVRLRGLSFFLFFFLQKFSRFIPKFLFIYHFFSNIKLPVKSIASNTFIKGEQVLDYFSFYFPSVVKMNKQYLITSASWQFNALSRFVMNFLQNYGSILRYDCNFDKTITRRLGLGSGTYFGTVFVELFRSYFTFLWKLFKYSGRAEDMVDKHYATMKFVTNYFTVEKKNFFDPLKWGALASAKPSSTSLSDFGDEDDVVLLDILSIWKLIFWLRLCRKLGRDRGISNHIINATLLNVGPSSDFVYEGFFSDFFSAKNSAVSSGRFLLLLYLGLLRRNNSLIALKFKNRSFSGNNLKRNFSRYIRCESSSFAMYSDYNFCGLKLFEYVNCFNVHSFYNSQLPIYFLLQDDAKLNCLKNYFNVLNFNFFRFFQSFNFIYKYVFNKFKFSFITWRFKRLSFDLFSNYGMTLHFKFDFKSLFYVLLRSVSKKLYYFLNVCLIVLCVIANMHCNLGVLLAKYIFFYRAYFNKIERRSYIRFKNLKSHYWFSTFNFKNCFYVYRFLLASDRLCSKMNWLKYFAGFSNESFLNVSALSIYCSSLFSSNVVFGLVGKSFYTARIFNSGRFIISYFKNYFGVKKHLKFGFSKCYLGLNSHFFSFGSMFFVNRSFFYWWNCLKVSLKMNERFVRSANIFDFHFFYNVVVYCFFRCRLFFLRNFKYVCEKNRILDGFRSVFFRFRVIYKFFF